MTGLDASGALANFERREEKVEQQEARAAALGEVGSTSLEQRFGDLETADKVERELAELKAKKARAGSTSG